MRINSQSGKGGVAFVMDTYFGFKLPKAMHKEFANVIQKISEKQGEVSPQQIMDNFKREYLDQKEPLHFKKLRIEDLSGDVESGEFDTKVIVDYTLAGKPGTFDAVGNGPIDAVKRGLQVTFGMNIRVLDYERACAAERFQCAGSSIYPYDGCRERTRYLWCRRKLQHHKSICTRNVLGGQPSGAGNGRIRDGYNKRRAAIKAENRTVLSF